MFSSKGERDYFWVSHAQLVQVVSLAVTAGLMAAAVYLRPTYAHPPHATPVTFTHMQEDFTQRLQVMYNSSADSCRLATPPVLRQILYHNLLPCDPNFLETHDVEDCDVEAMKNVKAYREPLAAPSTVVNWNESLCGPLPLNASKNHYTTGQDALPSLKCEFCSLIPDGYVLQLPFPNVTYQEAFLTTCVMEPMSIWFKGHVRNDTSVIISDAITVSKDNATVERHQLVYERLLPLNLWWSSNLPVKHRKSLWLARLAASLSFIVFLQQVLATLMELYGGGQYQTFFARALKTGLHLVLIFLPLGLFIFLFFYDARWRGAIQVLSSSPPVPGLSDNKKHDHVRNMYQGFSTLCRRDASVLWVVVALLCLQLLDLLTCTRGYAYGLCLAMWRLLAPLVVITCWVFILVLMAHVFHDEENVVFRDLRTSFRTLFVKRYLDVRYEEEASVPLMILLHVTIFMMLPLFLGLLLANLNVTREMKRGRKRWWARSQL